VKLAQAVHDYIALKQSLGSRFHTEATILKAFCNALGDVAIGNVEPHRVSSYLAGSGPVTRHWHRQYEALSGFYRFALARDDVLHSPLPIMVPKRPQPFQPYIYSQEE
jgi:integrase/recombinase XerD